MCSEPAPGNVFVGSLAEIDPRKVAEVARHTRDKKKPLRPIFSCSPIVRFRWKRARLSLFRPQPHLPSFIQNHPRFQDLLAKTTFRIVTIYGDPISDQIADNHQDFRPDHQLTEATNVESDGHLFKHLLQISQYRTCLTLNVVLDEFG